MHKQDIKKLCKMPKMVEAYKSAIFAIATISQNML